MGTIRLKKQEDINSYVPSDALLQISDMSKLLVRPLLLTGKPGTGKTQFAHWYANMNKIPIFQFNTKSTSVYSDLFYEYDAVSHFRNKKDDKSIADYITLTALGKAIVCAKGIEKFADADILKIISNSKLQSNGRQSVVLIDEVDKAPRDFPNDLLHEIEKLSFTIKELNTDPIALEDEEMENVVIILTSNNEKNLPDAFLRRCLFHFIEFPNDAQLYAIVKNKLGIADANKTNLELLLAFFRKIYDNRNIDKQPSTSECIEWINYLHRKGMLEEPLDEKFQNSLSILLKKKEDFDEAVKALADSNKQSTSA